MELNKIPAASIWNEVQRLLNENFQKIKNELNRIGYSRTVYTSWDDVGKDFTDPKDGDIIVFGDTFAIYKYNGSTSSWTDTGEVLTIDLSLDGYATLTKLNETAEELQTNIDNNTGLITQLEDAIQLEISDRLTHAVQKDDIVNNLTDGGADKALSAEMGAKVNEKIGYDEYSYTLGASTSAQNAVTIDFQNKKDFHIRFTTLIGEWRFEVKKKDGSSSYINPATFFRYGLTPSNIDYDNIGISTLRLYINASDFGGSISFSISYNLKSELDSTKEEAEAKLDKLVMGNNVGDVLAIGTDYNITPIPNIITLDESSISGQSVNLFDSEAYHPLYECVYYKQSTGLFIQDKTLINKGFVLILGKAFKGVNRIHIFDDNFDSSKIEQMFAFTISDVSENWNGIAPTQKGYGESANSRAYVQSTDDVKYLALFISFKNNADYNIDFIKGIVQTLNGSWVTEYIPYDESRIKYTLPLIEGLEDLPQLVESKLDKNQGAQNAGKILRVGWDGNVELADGQTSEAQDVTKCARKKDINKLHLGNNLLNGIIGTGAGWTHSDGAYTHTEGSEPLVFNASTQAGVAYIATIYTSTSDFYEGEIMVSIGEGEPCDIYKGITGPYYIGMISDGGKLKIHISSTRGLKVRGIELRKLVSESEAELTVDFQGLNVNIDKGDNITGFWNVGIGSNNCMQKLQNGSRNITIGNNALTEMTSGERNIAIGTFALNQLKRGTTNIAIGADALYRAKYANKNVAIGKAAAGYTHANPSAHNYEGNTAVGYNALGARAKDYNNNTAIGYNAMSGGLDDTVNREGNVAVGYEAGYYAGNNNVSVGKSSNRYTKGDGNVSVGANTGDITETGSNNILIGYNAKIKSGQGTWQAPAEHNNTIAIGANVTATKSNQVVIGNAQQTEVILLGNKRIIFNTDGTVTWESV